MSSLEWASQVAQWIKNLSTMQKSQETRFRSLGQEDPLETGMAAHSSTVPGEAHGQRSLVGYRPWGWTAEQD